MTRGLSAGWRICLLGAVLGSSVAVAQGLEISGTVVAPRGDDRVARAAVELEELLPPHRLAERQLAGKLRPAVVKRARTDGDGNFRLDVPEAGFWRLIVRHPDYLPAAIDLAPLLVSRALGELRLQRRSELAARVVDGDGRPLAGVTLLTIGWSEAWSRTAKSGWRPAARLVRTGERGTAALPCASSETLTVIARMGDRYLRRETGCGAMLLELVLEAPLSRARLVEGSGAPASSVYGFFTWPALAFGKSDEQGLVRGPFATPSAPPVAFADARGYHGAARWLPPAEEGDADPTPALKLRSGTLLAGTAVDDVDDHPLDGVWVWLAGAGPPPRDAEAAAESRPPTSLPPYFQSVERGGFELRLPTAASRIRLGGPGYLTFEYPTPAADAARDRGFVARLPPAMTLPGRVVDAAGAGIAEVTVLGRSAHPGLSRRSDPRPGGRWRPERIAGRSAEDGSFELSRIPPFGPLELTVTRGGFATRYVTVRPLVPNQPVDELVIALERGIAAAGFVVDEAEQPIPGAEVALLPALTGSVAEQSYEVKANYRATTGPDGGFTLRDLPAGRFFLSARAAGYPELLVPGIELSAGAEQPVDLGTAVLVPGVRLGGEVTDDGGRPVAAAELSLRDADGEPVVVQRAASPWFASTRSGADGAYQLAGLPRDRRLVLLAVAEGFLPREVPVTTGTEDQQLAIELSRGARVTGAVLDDSGRPAAGARVDFQAGAELRRMTTAASRTIKADAEGRFEVSGLRPGEYAVVAMAGAARSQELVRRIPAGGLSGVTLELRRRAALEVTVLATGGEPVAGAYVRLSGPALYRSQVTDADGRALLQPLEPGRYHLSASHTEHGGVEASVEIDPVFDLAQRAQLRFDRQPEAEETPELEVTGRVLDELGRPVAGARVRLDGPRFVAPAVSGADGAFSLRAPPGDYRLSARHRDYAAAAGRPLTLGGDVSGLVIELTSGATVRGRISGLELEDLSRLVVVARGPLEPTDGGGVFDRRYGTVDFSGELRIDGLGTGDWLVRAELLNPTRAASQRVTIAQGQREARVDLDFEPGHRMTGSLLAAGEPIAGATVSVACRGEFRGETFTGRDGRFAFDHVPEASCTVSAVDPATGDHGEQQLELAFDTEIVLEIGPGL